MDGYNHHKADETHVGNVMASTRGTRRESIPNMVSYVH